MTDNWVKAQVVYPFLVDFKEILHTILEAKLCEIMEKLGVITPMKGTVSKLYQQVRCKLKIKNVFSGEFTSIVRVK